MEYNLQINTSERVSGLSHNCSTYVSRIQVKKIEFVNGVVLEPKDSEALREREGSFQIGYLVRLTRKC